MLHLEARTILLTEARVLGAAVKIAFAGCADDPDKAQSIAALSNFIWERQGSEICSVAKTIRVNL